ncbi:putative late blight resistance protein R1B-13 isoform X2 [Salvia divinorum]|uniref:Late blight resistance protein R1B-13 isoform X2 n=1 Tax=Salvia divinorum TaxID=28513 RepID=A0ABD1I6D3_SALDI
MEVAMQEVESFEEMVNRMLWGSRRRIEGEFEVFLENIEVNECGPLAENCAEQIRRDRMGKRNILPEPDVDLVSTWNEGYRRP